MTVAASGREDGAGAADEAESTLLEEPEVDESEPEPEPEIQDSQPEVEPAPVEGTVVEALARIEDKLAESQRLIDRQTEVAAKLHSENQSLRGGELRAAQTVLVLGVLRVYDDVNQMALTTEDPAARRDLDIVSEALADALARSGVDPIPFVPGERFEPGRHKIAGVEVTADADADRTVARVARPGFAWSDGTVVRVSDVAVLKYEAPAEDTPSDELAG